MTLRIGILGTRGIPNHYGGFEQFAEYLSVGLAKNGHEVVVYNSHNHTYTEKEWNGVQIEHCYDPEYKIGTAGQFIYDLNCILDARKKKFDVILMLGYTSSSVWKTFFPAKSVIIFNMDGMEWKRDKYSDPVKKFLRSTEKLAVKAGDYFIADSLIIQSYLRNKYNISSEHIAYGAEVFTNEQEDLLCAYNITRFNYYLLMARMEPENNIETILDGFSTSESDKKFVVIGNTANKFGRYLVNKFKKDERIQFIGAIYDAVIKHTLIFFCELYFHGHSAGGTNPSLLEAMSSVALIAAHDNDFNKAILQDNALYFSAAGDVKDIIEKDNRGCREMVMIQNNLQKIKKEYTWEKIIGQYENFIIRCFVESKNERSILYSRQSYQ